VPGNSADTFSLVVNGAAASLVESIRSHPMIRLVGTHREIAGDKVGAAQTEARSLRAADLTKIAEIVALCRRLVFPGFFDAAPVEDPGLEDHVRGLTARLAAHLHEETRNVLGCVAAWDQADARVIGNTRQIAWNRAGLAAGDDIDRAAASITGEFLRALPRVRALLDLDVRAAFDGDPAAEHSDETILCYPGIDAVFAHRLGHEMYRLGVPLLPRVIAEQAHSRTGIDIHPGAQIGESFFIDHGSGVVIGETTVIGKNVKMYQGVTLGAKSFPMDERGRAIRGLKRHPTIGDRVTIYAGAVILGGDTVIGDDCVIAGGVFITSSVPAGHAVRQKRPELVVRTHLADESEKENWWVGDGI
jgi:serine O-acetyltransferase